MHFWHVRSDVAFGGQVVAWPGGQLRASANGVARELIQKCFGGQGAHTPLVVLPKVPGAHATLHEVEFAALNALQLQRVHGSSLNPDLNWPAGQALQGEPEDPGGHSRRSPTPHAEV